MSVPFSANIEENKVIKFNLIFLCFKNFQICKYLIK